MNDMTTETRMTFRTGKACIGLFAAVCAAFAFVQPSMGQVREKVTDRFPSGSIRSVGDADAALSEAAAERAEIEARYLAEEQACHPNFFTTSCIQKAKEHRRIALSALRPVELEASAFKRKVRVTERDHALAERLEKDEKQRQERASRVPAESEAAAVTLEASSQKTQTALVPASEKQPALKVPRKMASDRLSAEERSANIAAYEKKNREALERQQKVAQRKAEKEQKRKSKQAENKKSPADAT